MVLRRILIEEIAKAELMLSTSKMEGFGLAILESLVSRYTSDQL